MSKRDVNSRNLSRFLAEFPDHATSWRDATDELPDMYIWLCERTGSPPVGRQNCRTPGERNTKYKAAIRKAVRKLSAAGRAEFYERFAHWFK